MYVFIAGVVPSALFFVGNADEVTAVTARPVLSGISSLLLQPKRVIQGVLAHSLTASRLPY